MSKTTLLKEVEYIDGVQEFLEEGWKKDTIDRINEYLLKSKTKEQLEALEKAEEILGWMQGRTEEFTKKAEILSVNKLMMLKLIYVHPNQIRV
jgi:hypothetical protein